MTIDLSEAVCSCVRPLVFETGIEETPHSVFGSSFLVGYRGHAFVVTTRHTLQPDTLEHAVCVRSNSGRLFPLVDVQYAPIEVVPDDWADLAAILIDQTQLKADMGDTRIIPIDKADDWWETREVDSFQLPGFPGEHTYVDYDAGEVVEGLVFLEGAYLQPSASLHVHEIMLRNPPPLKSLAGFSGCPVFAVRRAPGVPSVPQFCGVAIQGTIESSIVRFVDRSVLIDLLDVRLARPNRREAARK